MTALPFTADEFFGVFRSYNAAVWPMQLVLNGAALAAVALLAFGWHRAIAAVLAALWAWAGIAYHLVFFLPINPAAALFGAAFLAAAAVFAWHGVVRGRLRFEPRRSARCAAGYALIAYALVVYPLASFLLRGGPAAAPSFGLPCPLTIFTLGMLAFVGSPYPRVVLLVPVLWTLVGSQAALGLRVYEDFGLLAAGAAGLWLAFAGNGARRYA